MTHDDMHDDHGDRYGNDGPDSLPDGELNLFAAVANPFEGMHERIAEAPREPDPFERANLADAIATGDVRVYWPGDVVEDEDGNIESIQETRRIDPESITLISKI